MNTPIQSSSTYRVPSGDSTLVEVQVSERGEGHPFLLLHGGGGPGTVTPWADALSQARPARVFTPVHPGFGGTSRPATLNTVRDLATLYVDLLDLLEIEDVTVVGSSVGGWIAAEIAIQRPTRVSSYVLIDAVGLAVPGAPVLDFFSLRPDEVAAYTFADPARYAPDPANMPAAARAAIPGNMASLEIYAGRSMTDPTLGSRLSTIDSPTLIVWGEEDRVAVPAIGHAYTEAVPGAQLALIPAAGHLPHVEAATTVTDVVWQFADQHATMRPDGPAA